MKRMICAAIISTLAAGAHRPSSPLSPRTIRPDLSGIWSTFPA